MNISIIQEIYNTVEKTMVKYKDGLINLTITYFILCTIFADFQTVQGILGTAAGILLFVGLIPYILAIFAGTTKPAKASWIVWAVLDTITLVGMLMKGSLNGHITGATIGVWIVVYAACKYGKPGWTKTDIVCMVGAAIGICLGFWFNNPTISLVISLIFTAVAAWPTIEEAWQDPSKEDKTSWIIFFTAALCATIAIPTWTLEDAGQPLTFLFVESTVLSIILFRKPKPTK